MLLVAIGLVVGCRQRGGTERPVGGRCGKCGVWCVRVDSGTDGAQEETPRCTQNAAPTSRDNPLDVKRRGKEKKTTHQYWSTDALVVVVVSAALPQKSSSFQQREIPLMRFGCAQIRPFALQGSGQNQSGVHNRVSEWGRPGLWAHLLRLPAPVCAPRTPAPPVTPASGWP